MESEEEGEKAKQSRRCVRIEPAFVEIKPATCTTFLGRRKPLKGCTKAQY